MRSRKNRLLEKLDELDLALGETYRGDCPTCNRKNTFTVVNEGGTLLYNCYANSCDIKGSKRVGLSVSDMKEFFSNKRIEKKVAPFEMPEYIIHHDIVNDYAKQYGLDAKHLGLMWDIVDGRVVFPIKNDANSNIVLGAIGRAYGTSAQPKWLRYDQCRTAYVTGTASTAVVVEDAVSAAVAETLGFTGVALLGTALLQEHKSLLLSGKYSTVIVALDPDACRKTLDITKELKGSGVNALAFFLEDDLKYRNEHDILRLTAALRSTNGSGITKVITQ